MEDLPKLPHSKQLIQLRICLSLNTQRLMEHTLEVPPSTDLPVESILHKLKNYYKGLGNEAIRRRELLSCKLEGEMFADYYQRLKRTAEEVDLCPGNSTRSEETQLKMVMLMGVREELTQKLISLDSNSTLDGIVSVCRSYEAAIRTTSAIHAPLEQVRAMSTYVKNKKGRGSNQSLNFTSSKCSTSTVCECCASQHPPQQCPASQTKCNNCGQQGHKHTL